MSIITTSAAVEKISLPSSLASSLVLPGSSSTREDSSLVSLDFFTVKAFLACCVTPADMPMSGASNLWFWSTACITLS
jgi:hydrogenase maturation factor